MARKFNPNLWAVIGAKSAFVISSTQLRVRLSKPGALFVDDVLAGYGSDFDLIVPEWCVGREAFASVDGVVEIRGDDVVRPDPEADVYTNADKRPALSDLERFVRLSERRRLQAEKAERGRAAREALNEALTDDEETQEKEEEVDDQATEQEEIEEKKEETTDENT